MDFGGQLDTLVDTLRERHPRFPRPTVERLVRRTAAQFDNLPVAAALAGIEREAEEQLDYLEDGATARQSPAPHGARVIDLREPGGTPGAAAGTGRSPRRSRFGFR